MILCILFVATAIVLWAMFAAPRSTYDVGWITVVVKVLVFGAAVIGLWLVGAHPLSVVFAVAVAVLHIAAALPPISAYNPSKARSAAQQ